MKISEKLKETKTPLNENELKELISEIEGLETSLETEKEEIKRLNKKIEDLKKEEPETENKQEEEKQKPTLSYKTGATSVTIKFDEEEKTLTKRKHYKVGNNQGTYVFKEVLETEPEKQKGKSIEKIELAEKEFFVVYEK